jgi:hypothetical protein
MSKLRADRGQRLGTIKNNGKTGEGGIPPEPGMALFSGDSRCITGAGLIFLDKSRFGS